MHTQSELFPRHRGDAATYTNCLQSWGACGTVQGLSEDRELSTLATGLPGKDAITSPCGCGLLTTLSQPRGGMEFWRESVQRMDQLSHDDYTGASAIFVRPGHVVYDTDLRDCWSGGRYKSAVPHRSLQVHPELDKHRIPPLPHAHISTMVKALTNLKEFQEAINQDRPVIIDFWATWCGPCKVISPVFEQLAGKFENVEFYKVDVDEAQDIAQEVGVRAMPTFMAFKNGSKIGETVGANPPALQTLVNTIAA
ncbi:thioredoxin [Trametes cingulata]|nr:thioredoxin [Trametes cingulata]